MILVVGATGLLGGVITRQLLESGQSVRILVRPGSPYQTLEALGAQPVLGDMKNLPSLASALAGVDTVITTATAGQRSGEDTVESVDLAGNRNLIEAAEQANVRQFIFVSTMGSDPNSPLPMMRAKGLAEQWLRESHLTYTILQSNAHMDVWIPLVVGLPLQQQRPLVLVGQGLRKHSLVAQQDVAAFAVAAIDHPAAHNQTIVIGGPDAISWRDIVEALETILGRTLPVESIAPGEQLPDLPPLVSVMMAALDTYDSPVDMRAATRSFGVALTPLEAWLRSSFVPLLSLSS